MPEQEKPLSPALENYLAIIFRQECTTGACRASDIADSAGVARSSVTSALRMLSRLEYIKYSPYRLINLTEKGLRAGQRLTHRNLVLQDFFQNILQLPQDTATAVACELEHVIPDDVMQRWRHFVLYMHHNAAQWQNWQEHCDVLCKEHVHRHRVATEGSLPPAIALRGQWEDED